MKENLKILIHKNLKFEPTFDQIDLIDNLSQFIFSNISEELFVIKGYAGTGKTTIVSSLVKSLDLIDIDNSLLAPTGRAAKVLANYSGKQANTIHRKIYKIKTSKDGSTTVSINPNIHKNAVFIVDEASMIGTGSGSFDSGIFGSRDLLEDLMFFVYGGENCKLILIGDTAQLPPVKLSISPAINIEYLRNNYHLSIKSIELKEVLRQKEKSGILENATNLRQLIKNEIDTIPKFNLIGYNDFKSIYGNELEDCLNDSHSKYGIENTILITRSNKLSNNYNLQIRSRILNYENELTSGDYLMVVRNNYFCLPESSKAGFVANGDIIEVLKVKKIHELFGFRFADVIIRLVDYPDEPEFETKLLLNTLTTETPALSNEDQKRLYYEVLNDYNEITNKGTRLLKMKSNKYYNALQVKFAYAVTCHKSQGGQWDSVFIDHGYLTDEMINNDFLRWLYTAITRATKKCYLVNFKKEFFNDFE